MTIVELLNQKAAEAPRHTATVEFLSACKIVDRSLFHPSGYRQYLGEGNQGAVGKRIAREITGFLPYTSQDAELEGEYNHSASTAAQWLVDNAPQFFQWK